MNILIVILIIILIFYITKIYINLHKSEDLENPIEEKNCSDNFTQCEKWAANDECEINPEYMLFYCAKSCNSCQMSLEEKLNLVKKYNSEQPKHCVYHGEPYPNLYIDTALLYKDNIDRQV